MHHKKNIKDTNKNEKVDNINEKTAAKHDGKNVNSNPKHKDEFAPFLQFDELLLFA